MSASAANGDERASPKCGHNGTDVGTISTTGGGLSKTFDVRTNQFKLVSRTNCGCSVPYRDDTPGASAIVDVFLG